MTKLAHIPKVSPCTAVERALTHAWFLKDEAAFRMATTRPSRPMVLAHHRESIRGLVAALRLLRKEADE